MLPKDIFKCRHIYHDKGGDTPTDTFKYVKNNLYKFVEKNTIHGTV